LFSRELPTGSFVSREQDLTRGTHGAACGITPLTPGALRSTARYPRSAKSFFFPSVRRDARTHARARTHRERRIAVEFTRSRKSASLLHALKSRTRQEDSKDHARRRGSLRAFTGLQFTRVIASLGLPAAAGRHSTTTATPALSSRYHYPHLVVARHRESQGARGLPPVIYIGVKNTHGRRVAESARRRGAARRRVEANRAGLGRLFDVRAQRESRVGRVKHGSRYCRLVQRVPSLLT